LRNDSFCSLEKIVCEFQLLKRGISSFDQVQVDYCWRNCIRVCSIHSPVCDKSECSILNNENILRSWWNCNETVFG